MTTHIKHVLRNLVTSNDWKKSLLNNWKEIIGDKLSDKVTLEKIYNTSVTLGVIDSCWLQELYLLSPILIKTINEKLDRPRIKQVRFKQIGKKKRGTEKRKEIKKEKNIIVNLSPREQNALKHVNDTELRKVLQSFCVRCHQERR